MSIGNRARSLVHISGQPQPRTTEGQMLMHIIAIAVHQLMRRQTAVRCSLGAPSLALTLVIVLLLILLVVTLIG